MRHSLHGSTLRALAGVGALLLVAAAPLFAQGSVTGRVIADEGKTPLGDVQILVEGTSILTMTNAEGRFTLRNVPAGARELRAFRVGYTPQKKPVTINSGETATVEFAMVQAIVKLQEVVTTATGEQRRVELGHTVATVDVAKKMGESPIKNFGDLLVAKAPGVQVLPANMTGGGSRVRIRGTSSFSLSNDPIYIIDGIRMTSGSGNNVGSAIGVGGTTMNRANDINPEEIENIEIVKGPSAATLYGTDAANGVIVITTKRGRAGRTNWNAFAEHGGITDHNSYPGQYTILGKTPGLTTQRRCLLRELSASASATGPTCVKDSTSAINVFDDPDLTMLKQGARDNFGVQASGGTEASRYFVSLDLQKETGPFGLPAFSERRMDSLKVPITNDVRRPSQLESGSFRANLNASLSPDLDIGVTTNLIRIDQRLPQVDNNVNSIFYNGMTGPGFKLAGPGYSGVDRFGTPLMGYGSFTPGDIFQRLTTQTIHRALFGTNINWRPRTWLAMRADMGVDLTNRADFQLQRFAEGPDFGSQRLGVVNDSRGTLRNFTSNLNATATSQLRSNLSAKTTLGVQYVNVNNYFDNAGGTILPPGAQTVSAVTSPNVSQGTTLTNTLGLFVDEAVALNDRLWVNLAVRTDQNSAFGTNFQRVYYPKVSASWMISDESFFPHIPLLSSLRLRSAYGTAGLQPGPNDALRSFQTATTSIANTDVTGLQSNLLGNPDIKPERTREFEVGFEAKLWDSRVNFDFTYYNKVNNDQLFNLPIAGSAGTNVTSVLTNLGATQNTGAEVLVNAQLLDNRNLAWDITVAASHNGNKLITLGTTAAGTPIPPIGVNTTVQQNNGLPLNSYWSRPYSFADANGDKIITPDEVNVDATWKFEGYSQPRDEVSITNGLTFLNRQLRLTALVDYKGGSNLLNNQEGFLCQNRLAACPYIGTLNPALADQARATAYAEKGTLNTAWGFIEPLQFWRIREVSLNYTFSDHLSRAWFRSAGTSISLAVRNVKVFTNYSGLDPEANYNQGDTQLTLLTAGPPRYVNLRASFRY